MQFGIMAMQLGLILPSGQAVDRAAVLAGPARFDIAALVERLADAGFSLIELNTELELFLPGCFDATAVERLAALRAARGLTYTVHLPLWSMEPATPDPHVRAGSLAALADAAQRLAPLAPEIFVLHATGALAGEFARASLPPAAKDLILERFHDMARASMSELLARTGLPPRRLALENVEFPLDFALRLAEEFDCGLCLDTGHVLAGYSGHYSLEEAVSLFMPRLAEVHLHDAFRGETEGSARVADHLQLGEGELPLVWLLHQLAAGEFRGPVILELELAQALPSLARIRAALG